MKKSLLVLMALMLWTCPVWADEIDDALPENTSLKIINNTRQMVQAGMSQDDATQLTRSMLRHRFKEENTIQAQEALMETMQSGLPVDPVMNKALEGMAKNKPDEAIVQAMQKTQSRYANAYRKAQAVSTDEETQNTLGQSIAQGMRAGLQDGDIDRVMTQLRTRTRQMSQDQADALCLQTFQTAKIMARRGVDSGNVSHVVSQALQNQFTARQMRQLGDDFSNQSQQGSPNQLANQFAQQMGQGENQGNSDSSNGSNAGQSGADQGSGNNGNDNSGSESGNASEGAGGSESGSDNSGGGSDNTEGSEGSGGSDNAEGSEGSGGAGSGSGSGDTDANTGGSGGNSGGGGSSGSDGSEGSGSGGNQ